MSSGDKARVGLIVPTYLEPEMLHIHRHVLGLADWSPVVVTQKIKGHWPGPSPHIVPRSCWREVGRLAERLGLGPWQLTRKECLAIDKATRDCRLLHIFFGNSAIHELGLLGLSGRPAVISFHGSDVTGAMLAPSFLNARRRMFREAALIACRSNDLATRVRELGCPPEKIRLLRTVLSFLPPSSLWSPPRDGKWRLLQAGRMVPKKGGRTLLRAFQIFHQSFPDAHLTMAGEGPLKEELSRLAGELGIAHAVDFPGFMDQPSLQSAFASCHIYLHPSQTVDGDSEGIPNALLEAMAASRPCVASRHGGIPEAIEDGVHGRLVPEGDPLQLARAITELARHPELAREMGVRARERVNAEFSPAAWQRGVSALYKEAAAT
ncbi:MAG: hypothetical protein Fur0032_20600 [Terrimicrobiaceae bacterium]